MAYTTLADDLKELHHPKTWVGKYVWSQDHKVIAVQYMLTAIAIGLVALVLSTTIRETAWPSKGLGGWPFGGFAVTSSDQVWPPSVDL